MHSYWQKSNLHTTLEIITKKIYEDKSNKVELEELRHSNLMIDAAIQQKLLSKEEQWISFSNLDLLGEYLSYYSANLMSVNWSYPEEVVKLYDTLISLKYQVVGMRDVNIQALLLMSQKYNKNIANFLATACHLQGSAEMKEPFSYLYDDFWKILPKLDIDAESIVRLLGRIGDGFEQGYGIYNAIKNFAAQKMSDAELIYHSLMNHPDSRQSSLIHNVLIGISQHNLSLAHERALELCDRKEVILRRVAISTLGQLKYENDQTEKLLPLTINKLQELYKLNDIQIIDQIVRAYEYLVKYSEQAKTAFYKFVISSEPVVWRTATSSLFQLAQNEYYQEWYQNTLFALIKHQNLTFEELETLDYCIVKYTKDQAEIAIQLIKEIANRWNFDNEDDDTGIVAGLRTTTRQLVNYHIDSLNFFLTKWIASKNTKLHLLTFELNSHFNSIPVKVDNDDSIKRNKQPVFILNKDALNTLNETTIIHVLLRIAGYVCHTQSLCLLLLSVLSRTNLTQKIIDSVIDLLYNYVLFNFPGEGKEYLENRKQKDNLSPIELQVIDKVLLESKKYLENRSKLPPLKEFQASTKNTYIYNLARWEQQEKLREEGNKKSVLMSILPERLFIYGKAVSSDREGEITDPMPLIPISASYEIPQGELLDPLGQTWTRVRWRQIGLESDKLS